MTLTRKSMARSPPSGARCFVYPAALPFAQAQEADVLTHGPPKPPPGLPALSNTIAQPPRAAASAQQADPGT